MVGRAQWELGVGYQIDFFALSHMFFYVKFNSKASLFSVIFQFWHSFLGKNALLGIEGELEGGKWLKRQKVNITLKINFSIFWNGLSCVFLKVWENKVHSDF